MKKYPFVKQTDLRNCGAACLCMIIQYYHGYSSLEKITELTNTNKNGVSAYQLIETAKTLGFTATGKKLKITELNNNIVPCIAYTIINNVYHHFVVIYSIDTKKQTIIVGDPAKKIEKMKIEEFQNVYQNVVLFLKPYRQLSFDAKEKFLENKIKQIIFSSPKTLIFIGIISIITIFLSIISAFYLKIAFEYSNSLNFIYLLFFIFLVLEMLKNGLNWLKNKISYQFYQKMDSNLTNDIYEKLIFLPYHYYRNKTTGDMITRFQDIEKIKNLISKIILNFSGNLLLGLFSILLLFSISKKLFLILIIIALLYSLIIFIQEKKILHQMRLVKIEESNLNSYLIESFTGFETIKGLSLEKWYTKVFSKKYQNFLKIQNNTVKSQLKEQYLQENLSDIGNVILVFISSILLFKNQITIGQIILFFTLSNYFLYPFKNLFELLKEYQECKISIQRLNEIIYKIPSKSNLIPMKQIELKNISYQIDEKEILNNVNLTIRKKDKIAFVGSSGSGKSTLLKMIKGYINSSIVYNDSKQNNIKISYLSQNEILFTDTVYQNITLGRSINQNDFNKAIKTCYIDEIIEDKIGYNELIEENGFNLSGGEKQRIILARTILKNDDVILIDEGLNQVDVSLERKIIKNIMKNYPTKTIVFVTHRMDNIDLFEKLWRLENKKVEEIVKTERNNIC